MDTMRILILVVACACAFATGLTADDGTGIDPHGTPSAQTSGDTGSCIDPDG
jgi:hypothetical protein